ncbi:MAG: FAD-binding oxidoreductase [Chloroflexota bacterium]
MSQNREAAYQALVDVLGPEFITDDLAIRHAYSKDASLTSVWRKHKKDSRTIPALVAMPSSTEEVQGVLRICNRYRIPVVALNTGANMCGLCVPNEADSLVLDLKRMDRILEIDEKNLTATIQPHVNFPRIQAETMKRGLWNGGTPQAPGVVGLLSNMMFNGIWQSALAYGQAMRSLINMTVVLPNGDIINTGSRAIPNAGNFWWTGPGPDLKGIFEFTHYGALGIVTEATVKLHRWAGGEWPQEEVYDHPPLPQNHRIFYIEYPDFPSMQEGMYDIAHSGIGTHLDTCMDAWNAYYTQPTQALAEKTFREGMWPRCMIYVILAGISSERQLDYEEKVLRLLVKRTKGKFREDLRDILSVWHADSFRAGETVRMTRHGGYAIARINESQIETIEQIHKAHMEIISKYPHYILDEESPEVYVYDRGYFSINETDNYYAQWDVEEVKNARLQTIDAFIDHTREDKLGWYIHVEPITSMFGPEIGPNFHLWLKRVKNIFDPNDIMNPGKLIQVKEKPAKRG